MKQLSGAFGSWNRRLRALEIRVGQRVGVAHGGVDAEAEEVEDAPDVAARSMDLLKDPVLTQAWGGDPCMARGTACRLG